MDMYSNFYPQPAPIHHMNAVPTHIQAGYPATNGYGVPTRVPPPPNSNQRRMDNRQNFQSDQNSSKTLWMGNIDVSMDENLIQEAFNLLGINVHNIKIIRNKDNGLPLGYGFVSFDDRSTAQEVLRELNGKKMPNVEEDKRFFLKRANRSGRYSVFVGNLPPQIDNDVLLNAFLAFYPSVSSAKVIMNDGISKGFGFVSFDDENEYFQALSQQSMMLGAQPISVSKARHNNNQGGGGIGGGVGNRNRFAPPQQRDQSFMSSNNRNDSQFRQHY